MLFEIKEFLEVEDRLGEVLPDGGLASGVSLGEVGEIAHRDPLFGGRGLAGQGLDEEGVDLGGVRLFRVEGPGPLLCGIDDKWAVQ